jgi:hypothetical protein
MPVAKTETAAKADVTNNVATSTITNKSGRILICPPY